MEHAVQLMLGGLIDAQLATTLDGKQASLAAAVTTILARRQAGEVGFLDVPTSPAMHQRGAIAQFVDTSAPAFDTTVVLGIGGSSLGPRALYSALGEPFDQLRERTAGAPHRLFFPDNVDPVTFRALLRRLDPRQTLWNVVTKSGGTAETAAQLLVVAEWLREHVGEANVGKHVVCTTDPQKGALRATAQRLGLPCFDVPPSVGGRFSVLTPVGLLPAALAGLDVDGLLAGAASMAARCMATQWRQNPALALAATLVHHQTHGRPLVVMMSYLDGLFDTADWFRQLWAESLGKAGQGPTPVAARGATDQHSQLQLYAEGPDDKVYLMLGARQRGPELQIPASALAASQGEYAYLAGRGMGELLDAELAGTIGSLRAARRPVGQLWLAKQDAQAVGELMMLLMAATAFAGPLLAVDPFDQPGVEQAKRLAFAALGRPGYAAPTEFAAMKVADETQFVF